MTSTPWASALLIPVSLGPARKIKKKFLKTKKDNYKGSKVHKENYFQNKTVKLTKLNVS